MPTDFLFVGRPEDKGWLLILRQALKPLGSVETISEKDADERIAQYKCRAIVIIDAAAVDEVPTLVAHLRRECPKSHIIVVTSSPTWQRARDALQAGAVGYIRKSWDSRELLNTIKRILDLSLPHEDQMN